MSYIKAGAVLPGKLLKAIQEYINGQYIYIPLKEGTKKPWGSITKSKAATKERNKNIFFRYKSGVSVKDLSKDYFLTDKTIYKIIADIKYHR
ncbi:Mor transcription activator family protein [Parelusimicrobium proximum]|uniref:CD3324 family protein n=1 Tax=Parelusimicrobium proximum TaxID=3228953 RepID=UPI003D16698C